MNDVGNNPKEERKRNIQVDVERTNRKCPNMYDTTSQVIFLIHFIYLFRFGTLPPNIFSSNLLKLYLNLKNFNDCLYLLDDHFDKLHTH